MHFLLGTYTEAEIFQCSITFQLIKHRWINKNILNSMLCEYVYENFCGDLKAILLYKISFFLCDKCKMTITFYKLFTCILMVQI